MRYPKQNMMNSTKNRKHLGFPASLLGIFTVACLAMVSIVPSTAEATVRAYIDRQGIIHYVREKSNETIKRVGLVQGKEFLEKGSGLLLLAGEKACLTGNARLLLTSRGK